MRIWSFLVGSTLLLSSSACEQLTDQRPRPEPPALPAVILEADPVVSLEALKMKVVYVGVDNPLDLRYNGTDFNDLTLIVAPPGYVTQHEKEYTLKVPAPGIQEVKVLHQGKLLNEFTFRAKRLPDPMAVLANKSSGKISSGEFRAQRGIFAIHPQLDFDVRCSVAGFVLMRLAPGEARQEVVNQGSRFGSETLQLVNQAVAGDVYTFTDVKTKCPGDEVARTINPLVFEIF